MIKVTGMDLVAGANTILTTSSSSISRKIFPYLRAWDISALIKDHFPNTYIHSVSDPTPDTVDTYISSRATRGAGSRVG